MFIALQDPKPNPQFIYIKCLIKSIITVGSSPPVTVEERALLDGPLCC